MEHDDQKLEAMIERLVQDDILESPSLDFTEKVMHKIQALETSSSTLYKPLISRNTWLLIAFLFMSLVAYIILNANPSEGQWLSFVEVPELNFDLFDHFKVDLSASLKYGALLLTVLIGVQITVIKTYFDRDLSV
jgi:hypothetical protein